jgi:nucleoside-diphosphate-sugar epimerase
MVLLVTGGAGFIGRAVVGAALEAGQAVRVPDPVVGDRASAPLPDGADPSPETFETWSTAYCAASTR